MSNKSSADCNGNIICRFWQVLNKPSMKFSLGAILVVGFVAGILFWGGFNTAMEMTNNEQFRISCHEMEDNVYEEYKETIHYSNRTGVRATCPDCHVPKEWQHKVVVKYRHLMNYYIKHWAQSTRVKSSKPSASNWQKMSGEQ